MYAPLLLAGLLFATPAPPRLSCDTDECRCLDDAAQLAADLPAPVLRLATDDETSIRSSAAPSHWTPLKTAHLKSSDLLFQISTDKEIDFESWELYLDGKPWSGLTRAELYSLTMTCPAPGRHLAQARYLSDDVWSRWSEPLRFEILPPLRPQIVAVGSQTCSPRPLGKNEVVEIAGDQITLRLANVEAKAKLQVEIDGKPLSDKCNDVDEGCCVKFCLCSVQEPGLHEIAVRRVVCGSATACAASSQSSEPIRVRLLKQANAARKTAVTGVASAKPSNCSCCDASAKPEADTTDASADKAFQHTFYASAHFPQLRFDAAGRAIEGEGVVIYEDMKVSIRKDGSYTVTLRTSRPELPATIRLRLLAQSKCGDWQTITLEPICVKPEPPCRCESPNSCCETQKEFTLCGRSAFFAEHHGKITTIERKGTARFGYDRADQDQTYRSAASR